MTKEEHFKEYKREWEWLKNHFDWKDDLILLSSMPTNFSETVELLRVYKIEHAST